MASKRHIRYKSCQSKQKHATQSQAVDHIISVRYRFGEKVHSYKCQFCHNWHVGH